MPRQVIIIRLRLDREIFPSDDLREVAEKHNLQDLLQTLLDEPIAAERAVKCVSVEKLLELEHRYPASAKRPRHSLTLYWRLDTSATDDSPDTWIGTFRGFTTEIATAYLVDIEFHELAVPISICPGVQNYLNAAPVGVDARWAWTRYHGKGECVRVIDVEAGWILGHDEIATPIIHYLDNAPNTHSEQDHGSASTGVIIANHDANDVHGIAPELVSLNASSHYRLIDNSRDHKADAITQAIFHLHPGDILLIEAVHWDNSKAYPVEILEDEHDAIVLAVDAGIVVIEAAGNSEEELSSTSHLTHGDSGATIVGACQPGIIGSASDPDDQGHKRWQYSNYGAKVDCYAWGQCIVTAGYGDRNGTNHGDDNSYTDIFGGTSGASAIIAGVAALVQSWVKARCFRPLNSDQMRTILSDPATGTIQKDIDLLKNDVIGVMPNLRKILGWRLWLRVVGWCLMSRFATAPKQRGATKWVI